MSNYNLEVVSEDQRNNKEIVMEDIKKNGFSLEFAGEDLRNDKEFVMEALKKYGSSQLTGSSLKYASEDLRNDKEIVMEALKEDGSSLEYASEDLRNDKEIVMEALKEDGSSLEYASEDLRNDKEFVMEALKKYGSSLQYASEDLRNDKEIVMEALKKYGSSLQYASEDLRNDKEFVMEAVKKYVPCLRFAIKEFRNNSKEIMIEVYGVPLKLKNEWLRNDKEFVMEAVKEDGSCLQFASEDLRNDKEFVMEVVKKDEGLLGFTIKEFRNNSKEIMIEVYGVPLKLENERLRNDKDLLMKIVKKYPHYLTNEGEEIRNDREFMMEVVKKDIRSFQYASEEIRNDKEIVMGLVKKNGEHSFLYASEELRNDKEFAIEVLKKNERILKYAGKEVILEFLENDFQNYKYINDELTKQYDLIRLLKETGGDVERTIDAYASIQASQNDVEIDPFDEKLYSIIVSKLHDYSESKFHFFFAKENVNEMKEEEEFELFKRGTSNIHFSDLIIVRFLGHGAFGRTYLCRIKRTKGLYVVKIYHDQFLDQKKVESSLTKDGLQVSYHKNIAPVLSLHSKEEIDTRKLPDYKKNWDMDIFEGGMLLMRFHRTTLQTFYDKLVIISANQILRIMTGIAQGVFHLHKNMIVHRDLHFSNIFVDPRDGRVWIGDFGCSLDLRLNLTGFKVNKEKHIMFSMTDPFSGPTKDFRPKGFKSKEHGFKKGGYYKNFPPEIRYFDTEKDEYLDYEKFDLFSLGVGGKKLMEKKMKKGDEREEEALKSFEKLLDMLVEDDPTKRGSYEHACEKISQLFRSLDETGLYI